MVIPLLAVHIMRSGNPFRTWGLETVRQIQADFYDVQTGLYGEERTLDRKSTLPSFNWGVGVLLQAFNAAARSDSQNMPALHEYIDRTMVYWNRMGPVPGYDVQPMPKPIDRYYDDNEWMALGLVEGSQVLKSPGVFGLAQDTYRFVRSGLDGKLGGGVYWRETEKTSKNACSNGPAAAVALALFERTGDRQYLYDAKTIYDWTYKYLRDPSDGLYWDNIQLNGKIEKTKWSYNSGLMLRSAAYLFKFTGDACYARDARELQANSLRNWVGKNGTLKDDGKFIHLLLENWLTAFQLVPKVQNPVPAIKSGLVWLHDYAKDSYGHYGNHWDRIAPSGGYSKVAMIDQASVARAYLITSEYLAQAGNR